MHRALLSILLVGCSAAPVGPTPSAPSRPSGLEVEPVTGLGLFADERAKSQAMIAQVVARRDAGVLPYELTERAWALAADGLNPLTGQACGKSLTPYQARRRWGAQLGVTGSVSSNLWCARDGDCELSVNGRPLDDDAANDRFRLVTIVSRSGDALSALAEALPVLSPPEPNRGGGGLGLLGGMGSNKPLQEEDLLDVRSSPADRRDGSMFEDDKAGFPSLTLAQVKTCLGADDSNVRALIEVSQAGAVTHCEGEPSEKREASACICGQLQRSAPAAALSGKRWSVNVSIDRRDQTTSDGRFVLSGSWSRHLRIADLPGQKTPRFKESVEDPSIEAWSTGPSRLAIGCFTNAFPAPGGFTSRWAVWFDGAGRPTKIHEQKGYPPLAKELADCVARALRTAQAPCPSRPGLWAMAELHVSARDPNAPVPSLLDALKKP